VVIVDQVDGGSDYDNVSWLDVLVGKPVIFKFLEDFSNLVFEAPKLSEALFSLAQNLLQCHASFYNDPMLILCIGF